eukprot:424982_1
MVTIWNLFVLLSFIWTIKSDTINCNTDYACQDKNMVCEDDEDCFIYCTRYQSCESTTFTCPKSIKSSNSENELLCHVECGDGTSLSAQACYDTKFNAYNSHSFSLTVNAGSQQVARSISVTCPCDGYCDIDCGDNEMTTIGCERFTVDALNSELTISGNGDYVFRSLTVYGTEAREISITASGSSAFSSASIYCPLEEETKLCHITYDGTSSYAFWYTNIYSVNSFYGVDLRCSEFEDYPCFSSSSAYKPTMNCLSDYSQSCTMTTTDGEEWTCEENSVCAVSTSLSVNKMFVLSDPAAASTLCTASPTEAPTSAPTASPNKLSIGTILFITFGSVIGVIVLLMVMYMIWRRKKKKPNQPLKKQNNANPEYHSIDSQNISMSSGQYKNEGQ